MALSRSEAGSDNQPATAATVEQKEDHRPWAALVSDSLSNLMKLLCGVPKTKEDLRLILDLAR